MFPLRQTNTSPHISSFFFFGSNGICDGDIARDTIWRGECAGRGYTKGGEVEGVKRCAKHFGICRIPYPPTNATTRSLPRPYKINTVSTIAYLKERDPFRRWWEEAWRKMDDERDCHRNTEIIISSSHFFVKKLRSYVLLSLNIYGWTPVWRNKTYM